MPGKYLYLLQVIHDDLTADNSLLSKIRIELQEHVEKLITTKHHWALVGWTKCKIKWVPYPPEEERIPERWFEDERKKVHHNYLGCLQFYLQVTNGSFL